METAIPSFTEFKIDETETTLHINIGKKGLARTISHTQKEEIADWCRKMGKADAWLNYSNKGKFRVLANLDQPTAETRKIAVADGRPDLLNVSQLDILEFLAEQDKLGKIVILTWGRRSHNANRAFYTSDRLTTERGYYTPAQFHDYDYLQAWRAAQPSLEKFNSLCDALEADNFAPSVDYRLVRPGGDLCEYQTDYYRLVNRHGEEIRAGVSDPNAYRVVQYAQR